MDDNLKKRGFTFLEVILVMIIISFSSLFLNTMMGVSLKGQTKASSVANKSYKSASNMELAVQSAREYSSYYSKMKNSHPSLAKRPAGYVDPKSVEFPEGLKIGNETIYRINGYFAIADDDDEHYKLNPGNASGFHSTYLYSYISQGYVTPNTSTFKEQYIKDEGSKKFVYMYDDESVVHDEMSGFYKLNGEDADLFKTARIRWYRTKALMPLFTDDSGDKLGGSDSIQLGKIQDIKDKKEANFKFSAPFPRLNDKRHLEFTDNEIYFTIQTLNKNGHVGPIDMSRGRKTGQVSTLYYIGLPYLYGLINHMDSSIMLRQDTDGKVKSDGSPIGKGTWYDILNPKLKEAGILKGDEVEDKGDHKVVKWKDVRDYINYEPRYTPNPSSLSNDIESMAFNFKEKEGKIELSDFSRNVISYEKDTVLKTTFPKLDYEPGIPSKGISLFMKFILNDSDGKKGYATLDETNPDVKNKPYNILSYNMKTSGDLIDDGVGNAGFSLFTDNNNKLYLQISTMNSVYGKPQPQDVIYCVSDDFDGLLPGTKLGNGLYNSSYNPYSMFKDENKIYGGRTYVKILGITLGTYKSDRDNSKNYINIYMVANAGNKKYNGVEDHVFYLQYPINPTTTDRTKTVSHEAFKAENELEIGGFVTACRGSSSGSVPALASSDVVNPEVTFTDVLYYMCDLSQYNNSIGKFGTDRRAYATVMHYLYRKSLSEDERKLYDENFYYERCFK